MEQMMICPEHSTCECRIAGNCKDRSKPHLLNSEFGGCSGHDICSDCIPVPSAQPEQLKPGITSGTSTNIIKDASEFTGILPATLRPENPDRLLNDTELVEIGQESNKNWLIVGQLAAQYQRKITAAIYQPEIDRLVGVLREKDEEHKKFIKSHNDELEGIAAKIFREVYTCIHQVPIEGEVGLKHFMVDMMALEALKKQFIPTVKK